MIRAVLDVNVVVSALLAPEGTPRQVLSAWQAEEFLHITSEGIVAEVDEKLRDPKIGGAYHVTEEDVQWLHTFLRTQAQLVLVPPQAVEPVTIDYEDNYVLASADLGQADYLVTGDRRLLTLGQYKRVKIVTPRAFLALLHPG